MVFKPGVSGNPQGAKAKAEKVFSRAEQEQAAADDGLVRIRRLIKSKNESIALRASIAANDIARSRQDEGDLAPPSVEVSTPIKIVFKVKENTAPPLPYAPKVANGE